MNFPTMTKNIRLLLATLIFVASCSACSPITTNTTNLERSGQPLFPSADFEFNPRIFNAYEKYGFSKASGDFIRMGGGALLTDAVNPDQTANRVFASYGPGPIEEGASVFEQIGYRATGRILSPMFTIDSDYINFQIGGGYHGSQEPKTTAIRLLVEGEAVAEATGRNKHFKLDWETWDVKLYKGKQAVIEFIDEHDERDAIHSLAYIAADNFLASNTPATFPIDSPNRIKPVIQKIYSEPFRPQFHYSAPAEWVGDPDGPLYHDGKYHIFYWGHAQSDDLIHWEQLPRALYDDSENRTYTGSVIIDHNNTSGFSKNGESPWIAIYTGHGDKQTQLLAYSNDNGVSWNKYQNNPVLDINSTDFRDPQIFWHHESQQWIMSIALPLERKIQFYQSENLINWTLASTFGPAGSTTQVWEVSDLFPMRVNSEANNTKWVLVVSVGEASGQYFVGHFDGNEYTLDPTFEAQLNSIRNVTSERGNALWVDYGDDYYAFNSFMNDPVADTGKRLATAWIGNWKYANDVPTFPWKGFHGIPRELSLETDQIGNFFLRQHPVSSITKLRNNHWSLPANTLVNNTELEIDESEIYGDTLEIHAILEPVSARKFGIKVRIGESEETLIGYDLEKESLYFDRSRSGLKISERFDGYQSTLLKLEDGKLKLRIFVDRTSVEVFANDGIKTMTNLIFPSLQSDKVSVYAEGGAVDIVSLDIWQLNSIWH
ncbi:MAG: glycoside hydrolase family 32 protein [Gammaproteobacteria bacterium]|nr:glycoside hydrolase family 32 protein [Gammaproteobacteria bacterium]